MFTDDPADGRRARECGYQDPLHHRLQSLDLDSLDWQWECLPDLCRGSLLQRLCIGEHGQLESFATESIIRAREGALTIGHLKAPRMREQWPLYKLIEVSKNV